MRYINREGASPVQDERELIRRAQECDSQALAAIYEQYYQGIYNYIFYRVGDDSLAEDLTAEVFVKVLEAIDSFTFRGVPFSSWLYRIAGNRIVDYFRRQPKQPAVALDDTLIFSDENPVDLLERGLTQHELRGALDRLTEDQKQVIILKFVDGLSNTEVAKVLRKSEGAIKSLQHRGLASLARHLGEMGRDGTTF